MTKLKPKEKPLIRPEVILLILIGLVAKEVSGTDQAFVDGTTGTLVVERCVDLITKSGIFPEDKEMLRRLAYVESRDGKIAGYSNGSGGIWQITTSVYNSLLSEAYNTTSYYDAIQSYFNIDWSGVTYSQFGIPIYSALATRLALAYYEIQSGNSLPDDVQIQYDVWNFYLQDLRAITTLQEFTTLVAGLPVSMCDSSYRDVIFLVESTSSISNSDFDSLKTFLLDVIDNFEINSSETRIGIIQFASGQETVLELSGGTSESAVINAINAMTLFTSDTVALIGSAILQAVNQFSTQYGGRNTGSGAAKVLVIITHTDSNDNATATALRAYEENIGVIAIGVSSNVVYAELSQLTYGVKTTHIYEVQDYNSLVSDAPRIELQICEEPVISPADTRISGTLEPGENQIFSLRVPVSGTDLTISTTTGTVAIYYAIAIPNPSAVANLFSMIVSSPNVPMFYNYVPTNAVILYATIVPTSTTVAVFQFLIGNPPTTIITTAEVSTSPPIVASSESETALSAGEIVGIVFACLIFLFGLLIALFYYYCHRRGADIDIILLKEKVITPVAAFSRSLSSDNERKTPANVPAVVEVPISPLVARSLTPSTVVELIEVDSVRAHTEENESVMTSPLLIPSPDILVEQDSMTESTCIPAEITSSDSSAFPGDVQSGVEKTVRDQLRLAIETNDVIAATAAVQEFHKLGLVDFDGDLIKGERVIGEHECLQGLSFAIAKRDVKTLEKAIFTTKQQNYQKPLKAELNKAEILLQDLKKMQNMLHQLDSALKSDHLDAVEKLSFEIRAMSGFDQATVDRMLGVHRCREDLNKSMATRDLLLATVTLDVVEKSGYQPDLQTEVKQTKKMTKELEYLEKVRKDVLNLSQAKVSEIRSYSNPPAGVHEVMSSVYLLLGYPSSQLKNWTEIQALMGKSGLENLKRQILEIDPRSLSIGQAQAAKEAIAPFSMEMVQECSLGLALFHVFSLSVIEEVEKLNAGILDAPSPFFFDLAKKNTKP